MLTVSNLDLDTMNHEGTLLKLELFESSANTSNSTKSSIQ